MAVEHPRDDHHCEEQKWVLPVIQFFHCAPGFWERSYHALTIMNPTKQCARCEAWKPLSAFSAFTKSSLCASCADLGRREWAFDIRTNERKDERTKRQRDRYDYQQRQNEQPAPRQDGITSSATATLFVVNRYSAGASGRKARS